MRAMKYFQYLCGLTLFCAAFPAHAALDIEIIGAGEHQIPISIVPFAGEEKLPQSISGIVAADLTRSGLFRIVDANGKAPHEARDVNFNDWAGVDDIAIGGVELQANGRMDVKFRLLDVVNSLELTGQEVSARSEQTRAIAHRIADMIFEKLTGNPGVFSTRIAYVNRKGKANRLVVADSDGYNEQTVLSVNSSVMSPSWSADGSHLAYVSFEQGHAVVYVQSLFTNQRMVVANFEGSNSAPSWSPDGSRLAVVLTREGGSHIYTVRPDGTDLRQLTSGGAINTEPCFSPDGQSLIFASDRGGSVQIYKMPVDGGTPERLTFEGGNNFSPRYSQDGKSFVFSHWDGGRFYIATEDFQTRQMQILTDGGWEKKPSFAPNGKIILFATESQGRGILETVSSDGRVRQKMYSQSGDIRDPMWGPFVRQ
jgi:TolB protein